MGKICSQDTLSSKAIIENRRRDKIRYMLMLIKKFFKKEIKSFPDKQKLKDFVTTKPALQEILKGIF